MLSQTVSDALLNPGNTNIKPGLRRMQQVLENLGNPQHQYKVIHITGTNGKGSTAAFIATGLIHAGFKTGKFMSPHIFKINECITINNQEIADSSIERNYFLLEDVIQKNNFEKPSPFELLTLIMFCYMAEQRVDYLVLEAGMGGETDCTNVVDSLYSIITNVGLEHTKWLGNTLEKIAKNKAGIVKSGKTIIADNRLELLNAVKDKTNNYVNVLQKYKIQIELDNEKFQTNIFIQLKDNFSQSKNLGRKENEGIVFAELEENVTPNMVVEDAKLVDIKSNIATIDSGIGREQPIMTHYNLSLYGKFQAYNFMIAYEIFKNLGISEESIMYAANRTFIPYRLQIMQQNPLVIYDITHNLSGALALVDNLINKYNPDDVVFITAILGDKDITQMLQTFNLVTNNIIFTNIPENPRALSNTILNDKAHGLFLHKYLINDCKDALQFAKSLHKKIIIVCGSSYIFQNLI